MIAPGDIPRNMAFARETEAAYADECNRQKEQAAHLAYAALLAGGEEPADVAVRYGVAVEAVQRVCGEHQHSWTRWEAGDGVWYQQGGEYCEVCFAGREEDGD